MSTKTEEAFAGVTDDELKAALFAFDSIAWMPSNRGLYEGCRTFKDKIDAEVKRRALNGKMP